MGKRTKSLSLLKYVVKSIWILRKIYAVSCVSNTYNNAYYQNEFLHKKVAVKLQPLFKIISILTIQE